MATIHWAAPGRGGASAGLVALAGVGAAVGSGSGTGSGSGLAIRRRGMGSAGISGPLRERVSGRGGGRTSGDPGGGGGGGGGGARRGGGCRRAGTGRAPAAVRSTAGPPPLGRTGLIRRHVDAPSRRDR